MNIWSQNFDKIYENYEYVQIILSLKFIKNFLLTYQRFKNWIHDFLKEYLLQSKKKCLGNHFLPKKNNKLVKSNNSSRCEFCL